MNKKCDRCDLSQTCKTVKMDPDGTGDIVFLGEAPGAEEDLSGRPFQGASGRLLRQIVSALDIDPERFRFTNVVRCRPPQNATPERKHIKACLDYLVDEFLEHPARIIIPLGNVATKALQMMELLPSKGTIGTLHGKPIAQDNFIIFPLLHPAYILRNPQMGSQYIAAFNNLEDVIKNGIKAPAQCDYTFSDEIADLKNAIKRIKESKIVAYDIETSALYPYLAGAKIITFSLSWEERQAFGFALTDENRAEALSLLDDEVLENPEILKIIQHAKFELMWSMHRGRTIVNIEDTMLLHWHANEKNGTHNLKNLAVEYTDLGYYEQVLDDYKKAHKEADPEKTYVDPVTKERKAGSYANIPIEMLLVYNCQDTDATFRIRNVLKNQLNEKQLWIHDNIQIPACYPLADMELRGVRLNLDYLKVVAKDLDEQEAIIESKIHACPEFNSLNNELILERGEGISLSSTKDLRMLLFTQLRLPSPTKTETGLASTDKNVLAYLSQFHEIPKLILERRKVATLRSNFVEGLDEKRVGEYIHTSYGMAHTETGRYNSKGPNLQNIPRGPTIKTLFIPDSYTNEKGYLVQWDYSQIELRILAIFSQDEQLLSYFRNGVDVHRYIAAKIHKKSPEAVTKEERTHAKRTVFGLCYGQGAKGLSEELGIRLEEAESFLRKFFKEFPGVKEWMEATKRNAARTGRVETLFGRVRRLPDAMIQDPEDRKRAEAMRQAINQPIQGSATDVLAMKKAELWLEMEKEKLKSRMLLTVHDQILFSVPASELAVFLLISNSVLQNFRDHAWAIVPILADCEIGENWGEMHSLSSEIIMRIENGENPETLIANEMHNVK